MGEAILKRVTLTGFRAYLKPRSFDLARGKTPLSLALFAENALGKSSLVDGLEFYLSEKGIIPRLGQAQTTTQGGAVALEHVDARDQGIEPAVTIAFQLEKHDFSDKRIVGQEAPAGAKTLQKLVPVNPIIRGYQLRQFVEDKSEADRYAEVAGWFGLQPLVNLQDKLAKLKRDYKKAAEDMRGCESATSGLSAQTGGAVGRWDEVTVLNWVNTALVAPLKCEIPLKGLVRMDEGYLKLIELKQTEDTRLGLPKLKLLKQTLEDIVGQIETDAVDKVRSGGKGGALLAARGHLTAAEKAVDEARTASARAFLSPIWEKAVATLENPNFTDDRCPVCETGFADTVAGERGELVARLKGNLSNLATFHKANEAFTKAELEVRTATSGLDNALIVLRNHMTSVDRKLPEAVVSLPESSPFTNEQIATIQSECGILVDVLDAEIADQEAARGTGSCKESLEKVEKILEMAEAHKRAMNEVNARKAILAAVTQAAELLNSQIQAYVSGILTALRKDVDAIYKQITHSVGRPLPNINLELPDAAKKDRMCLTIDFAPNRKKVAPGGYLSDAQLHSLGLALRLAAIRRFNTGARFVVLDDVVTSYDRDHRQKIANLLAAYFQDFQVIVVTHERQFFEYLREKLPRNRWDIKQISEIVPSTGPIFVDDCPTDEEIEDLLRTGKSAVNEIRKAYEVWLQKICFDFGVSVTMPKPTELPKFGRAELASALEGFVNKRKMSLDPSFFVELKEGEAENAGSHGNTDASAGPSAGDMKTRWEEFKKFRGQFVCACGYDQFTRSKSDSFPRCKNKKCELPFKGVVNR